MINKQKNKAYFERAVLVMYKPPVLSLPSLSPNWKLDELHSVI